MAANGAPNGFIAVFGTIPSMSPAIHTTLNSATVYDEVWIWAVNHDSSPTNFRLAFAMGTATATTIKVELPADSGMVLISPGLLVSGDGTSGMAIGAGCDNGSCSVIGYVNRIS